jgi:ribonuclease T1
MMRAYRRLLPALLLMAVLAGLSCQPGARQPGAPEGTCESVVHALNQRLHPGIDEEELVSVLRSLTESGNRKLPQKFVTKGQAKKRGWRPGRDLWRVPDLRGKSIGGDRFQNREGKLPDGGRGWREADLDYKGGKRGAKRLVFSDDGKRMVTVDHYHAFTEVPACR